MDLDHGDLDERLDQALSAAVELFGVDGAGLTLVTEEDTPRCIAASGPAGRALEKAQESLNEGSRRRVHAHPCGQLHRGPSRRAAAGRRSCRSCAPTRWAAC